MGLGVLAQDRGGNLTLTCCGPTSKGQSIGVKSIGGGSSCRLELPCVLRFPGGKTACHRCSPLRAGDDSKRTSNYARSILHVLKSHSFRSRSLKKTFAIIDNGKTDLSFRDSIQGDFYFVSFRVFNRVANRLFRNPVNVQRRGWFDVESSRDRQVEFHFPGSALRELH